MGIEMKNIILNEKEMKKYFEMFDPIEKKYHILLGDRKDDSYWERYRIFQQYEENHQFSELTKKEFGDIQANLDLVYANKEMSEDIIDIYDLVCYKIINQYLNVEGIERLFSEKYINFEWEMHLGIDYKGHSMKFYRDHFIHQVRDAFCMECLLSDGNFAQKIKEVLMAEGNSKISRYVCKHIRQQVELQNPVLEKYFNTDNDKFDFFMENTVYMASYMSALFHDIGYPEVNNIQSGRNIMAYIANVYNFGSGYIDFDRIITILQNSLLFRVVSPAEIRKRIEAEKIDHATVSALMFLLHFYENGAVYGLEPYKLCAVELAGLAIYNHTNSYACIEDKAKDECLYERNVFVLNPISYLLRICDDLQEWGRIYFEISAKANIILCNQCHTPIVRRNWKGKDTVYYLCNCNEEQHKGVFEPAFCRNAFPYRRLYNVTVCRELQICYDGKGNYIYELQYDLERLLYVAYINTSYAKYRVKELNQVKKLMVRQGEQNRGYLKYFVTANIILIKAQIVKEYLRKQAAAKKTIDQLREEAEKIVLERSIPWEAKQNELHKKINSKAKEIYNEHFVSEEAVRKGFHISRKKKIKDYVDKFLPLYIYLCLVLYIGEYANEASRKDENLCTLLAELGKNFKGQTEYTADALALIEDCCEQATRMFVDIEKYTYYPDKYFRQFVTEEGFIGCCKRFADSDLYIPVKDKKGQKGSFDAYTDLYYFTLMLQELKQV